MTGTLVSIGSSVGVATRGPIKDTPARTRRTVGYSKWADAGKGFTLNSKPYALHSTPYTLNPEP